MLTVGIRLNLSKLVFSTFYILFGLFTCVTVFRNRKNTIFTSSFLFLPENCFLVLSCYIEKEGFVCMEVVQSYRIRALEALEFTIWKEKICTYMYI